MNAGRDAWRTSQPMQTYIKERHLSVPSSNLPVQALRRIQGVFQQAGPRHRTNPTGNGGDPAGALAGSFEFHIAQQTTVRLAIDTHVDDDGTRLDRSEEHTSELQSRE